MHGQRARRPSPRQTRRQFVRLAAGGTMGLALACGPSAPPPAAKAPAAPAPAAPSAAAPSAPAPTAPAVRREPDVVRRGTLRGISFGAVIARERGYFAELGIDDQETVFASGVEMVQAGAAGQIDIGATSNTVTFFNAVARGLRQPFVLDIWHLERGDNSAMVAVRPDLADTMQQVADLRGRINATSTPNRDGGQGFQARKVLASAGLTFEDMQWERLSYPDMLAAFGNRAIDAAWMIEPFITLGKQRGLLVPWVSLGDYDPGFQLAGIVFSESFIRERTDVARRWSVAYVRGLRDQLDFMNGKDRDVIGPILAAHTGVPPEAIHQVAWGPVHPDGRLNVESILDAQRQLVEWGTLSNSLPVEQVVDPQFYEYALQQLGPYRG
jgi:NitT/TauT family transport system substrate-binding protein